MIRIFIAVLLCSVPVTLSAQRFPDSLYANTTLLRFNPFALVPLYDLNISFGVEQKISKKSSFALDLGYVPYSEQFSRKRANGFVIRPAYRFFPNGNRFFLEAELHYKQVTQKMADWIGRDVVNNVPAYEEYVEFKLRKKVWGAHLKLGRQYYISNRLWLEFYLGFGVHYRRYSVINYPGSQYQIPNVFNFVMTGQTETLAALPAGLRILYRIDKPNVTHPKQ